MQNETINRRDAETQSFNELTERVIGACIEIHRALGPGLLESAYEECLCHELSITGISFERQKPLPVHYKNVKLDCGYRLDLVVEQKVIVELKTVETLMPIHEAQLLTYLKLSGLTLGLLINFNVPMLKNGIKRIANNFQDSASPRLCGEIKFG
ncbi:MAG TPA: GxxExxY protein [Methylomirabilota bacterium]|nr:GxxExxY protein [Methylomirabilota bacterium]